MLDIVCVVVLICLFLVIGHRYNCGKTWSSGKRQRYLIWMVIVSNLPLLVITVFLTWIGGSSVGNVISSILYVLLAFNAFGYAYFHLFNMSETARRIKILMAISDRGLQFQSEVEEQYSPSDMIRQRLDRLEDMGQIRKDDEGNYLISSRSLLGVAVIFRYARNIVMGRQLTE